jgi:hypothetical protein
MMVSMPAIPLFISYRAQGFRTRQAGKLRKSPNCCVEDTRARLRWRRSARVGDGHRVRQLELLEVPAFVRRLAYKRFCKSGLLFLDVSGAVTVIIFN